MKQKHSVILILLSIVLLSGCAQSFLWKGQYLSIMTKDTPKEDFRVNNYIVISYAEIERKKNPSTLYQFAVIENGQQIRLITVDRLKVGGGLPDLYLEETDSKGGHRTYTSYTTVPTYEEVKFKIIGILSEGKP
jgi:hypothetical protein